MCADAQAIDVWDFAEAGRQPQPVPTHDDIVASVASSACNALAASASHDRIVKLFDCRI